MPLTGSDVWEVNVKLGLMSGPYDPKTNRYCANADRIAGLLNEVLGKQESNWLPKLMQTEDAMRAWLDNTPRSHTYAYRTVGAVAERRVPARRPRHSHGEKGNLLKKPL